MTLRDISTQIHSLAVGGIINGEQYTRSRLEQQLRGMLREDLGGTYIFEINLPDGRWLAKAYHEGGQYDYWIPDTRDQEARLWRELGIS